MTKTKLLIKTILAITCCLGIVLFINNSDTFAITKVWTGDAGYPYVFSDPTNWSDGTVPVDGDDLIIRTSYSLSDIYADIPGLQVNSVELDCSNGGVGITGTLTVTDSIFSSGGCSSESSYGASFSANLNLVSNLTVTNVNLSRYAYVHEGEGIINLNSYTLDLNITNSGQYEVTSAFVGSGTVNFNGDPSDGDILGMFFFGMDFSTWTLDGDLNDFIGTININTTTMLNAWNDGRINSVAVINIQPNGYLVFRTEGEGEGEDFINPINIYRSGPSLAILCVIGYEVETCQIAMPNVTLYANTTFFAVRGGEDISAIHNMLVDLTGITTNGYCINYETVGISEDFETIEIIDGSNLFTGGPDETCEEGYGPTDPETPDVTDPDAPNTGELIFNNTSLLMIISVISVLTIGLAFKLRVARR